MRANLTIPSAVFLSLLAAAMATGNPLLFLLALLTALTTGLCLAGVLWASATLRVSAETETETVYRGEDTVLVLRIQHRGWIPIAPVILELSTPTGEGRRTIRLRNQPGRAQMLRMPLHAAHVGVYSSGIHSCTVEDLLGIFRRRIVPNHTECALTVLPLVFETEPLEMAPGDPGSEMMARATEDLNAPSDIRAYQPGDAMKKIHWKLSLRKGELMVRKFDEPVLQDVLILMDCSPPPSWGHPQAAADLRDALLETAASVFTDQLAADHVVHMPLSGAHPVDVEKSMGLAIALENLARTDFTESDRFERVLSLESRRLRKVGCTVVIAARLTGAMVDIMIRMRRMGPAIRFYLITFAPDDANLAPLITRLRRAAVEVSLRAVGMDDQPE